MFRYYFIAITFAIFIIAGCSHPNEPITNGNPNSQKSDNIPMIMNTISDSATDAIGLMGSYNLSIDPLNMKADLVSNRASAIGESYIVSGTAFFTMTPCSNCLKIKSVALTSDGKIQLTFYVRHPFLPGDPYKPPTGRNRLDLDIFDLALLVHPVDATPSAYTLTGTDAYTGALSNSNGYTTELADVITDEAAIPYVLIIDDSISGTPTYNKFAMGAEAVFNAVFNLTGDLNFDLFLTMGYGASAKKSDRLVPRYFNPEFNRKSAWKVDVIPPQGTNPPQNGNTWNNNDSSALFNVTVKVYDWQIGANVNPGLVETTDIYAASDVGSVSVEIPGMTSSLPSVTTATSGTGTPSDPLLYTIPIANQNLLEPGDYIGLVKVTDTRMPGTSTIGGETDTLVHAIDGMAVQWYEMNEFATYQAFTATVVVGCGPITGEITSPSPDPFNGVASGSSIDFSATASSTNGGDPVVLYEWDKDYDGNPAHFNVDATGEDVNLGPFINPNCPNPIPPKTYVVAVRGTDSCTPPNVTIFDTIDIVVDLCIPPSVGNIVIKTNRISGTNYIIDESGAFTITWTAIGGIPEYAVYYDTNPDDGLMNNFLLIGTTTTNSWTGPASPVFPTNHYVKGWTFIVRARGTAGNPASEGLDSEPAYATFNGWETVSLPLTSPYRAVPGVRSREGVENDGEGWLANHETERLIPVFVDISWPTLPNGGDDVPITWMAHGTVCCQFSPFCNVWSRTYGAGAGAWNGITKKTPDVPSSTVRFLEFSLKIGQVPSANGLIIGSIAVQPGPDNFLNTTDFKWAQLSNIPPYQPYNTIASFVMTVYGNMPSGQNNAVYNSGGFSAQPYLLRGGDVNLNGYPEHEYVGIQYADGRTANDQPYPVMDEMAILIY